MDIVTAKPTKTLRAVVFLLKLASVAAVVFFARASAQSPVTGAVRWALLWLFLDWVVLSLRVRHIEKVLGIKYE